MRRKQQQQGIAIPWWEPPSRITGLGSRTGWREGVRLSLGKGAGKALS